LTATFALWEELLWESYGKSNTCYVMHIATIKSKPVISLRREDALEDVE